MPPLAEEVLLDIFHHLCRWDLDAAAFSCDRFQSAITKRMTTVCLRRLRQAKITKAGTFIVTERDPNRFELSRPEDLPRYLRSAYVGYLGLGFPEPMKSTAFDAVMAGLEENASVIATYKLYFEEGDFSREEFGRITRLCKSLSSLSHLQFNECRFPTPLALGKAQRLIDDEVLDLLRKDGASAAHFLVSFSQAEVSGRFIQNVIQARKSGELNGSLNLSINGRRQDTNGIEADKQVFEDAICFIVRGIGIKVLIEFTEPENRPTTAAACKLYVTSTVA